jgi:hypothetical protein
MECNPEEVAVPIVVHKVVAEVVQAVHMAVEVVAPIVVHKEIEVAHKVAVEVVQAVHMAVEVAHKEIEAAAPNLAAEVGLDHKTSIIPSC